MPRQPIPIRAFDKTEIVEPNAILARNGVVHVIDTVILPKP
jgi:uncharacterized surface protein with fasciclin (FAS1) repeats